MTQDALLLEGVRRTFGTRTVLDGVGLRVAPGQVVALTGRSGSGKTTVLNVAAGLDDPDEGRVLVGGQDLSGLDAQKRSRFRLERVGFVFQQFNLLPDLTVAENVMLPLHLAGKRRGSRERAVELLEHLGLGPLSKAFPETLSGGEMQRVAIARSLALNPVLILADEPTASVDDEAAKRVLETFRAAASTGAGVLVASHDPLARDAADVVYDLIHGRAIVRRGPDAGVSGDAA